MARNQINLTRAQWSQQLAAKSDEQHKSEIDKIYNRVVEMINAAEGTVTISPEEFKYIPEVNRLLNDQGFGIVRNIGDEFVIRVYTDAQQIR